MNAPFFFSLSLLAFFLDHRSSSSLLVPPDDSILFLLPFLPLSSLSVRLTRFALVQTRFSSPFFLFFSAFFFFIFSSQRPRLHFLRRLNPDDPRPGILSTLPSSLLFTFATLDDPATRRERASRFLLTSSLRLEIGQFFRRKGVAN